jgi:hypothetical protein
MFTLAGFCAPSRQHSSVSSTDVLGSTTDGGRDKGIHKLSQLEAKLQKSPCSMQSPLQYNDSTCLPILKVFCSEVCGVSSLTLLYKHVTIDYFSIRMGNFGYEV